MRRIGAGVGLGVRSALAVLVLSAGCGKSEASDAARGYTKPPLEDPGLTITREKGTRMDELGEPNLPTYRVLEAPDSGAAQPKRGG